MKAETSDIREYPNVLFEYVKRIWILLFFFNLHQPWRLVVKIWMKETKPNTFRFHSFRLAWRKFAPNFLISLSASCVCATRVFCFSSFSSSFSLCFRGFSQIRSASIESSFFIQMFRENVPFKEQKGENICLQKNVHIFFFYLKVMR